jgi:hypothetical protein
MCVSYSSGPGKVYQEIKGSVSVLYKGQALKDESGGDRNAKRNKYTPIPPLSKPGRTALFPSSLTPKQVSLRLSSHFINIPPIQPPSQPRLFRHVLTLFISSYSTQQDSIILSSLTPFHPSRYPPRTLYLSHRAPWEIHL